jgi:Xaa-Pro aminopeptidase
MPNVLIYADTVRTPELRQEIPHAITDPLLYGEVEGRRFAVVRSLEVARMSEIDGLEVVPEEELGLDDLQGDGMSVAEAHLELALRACRRFELDRAVIPPGFPTELGADDHDGIRLPSDSLLEKMAAPVSVPAPRHSVAAVE